MSLEDLRRQYTMGGLDESSVPSNPMELFSEWMTSALDNAPVDWVEPYAMTLATTTSTGEVSARIVLLRGFDAEGGFTFYTNYESAKGQQLAANNSAALVFYWGYLERQIRITGSVEKVSRELSQSYFQKRPRGSQIGASVSRQSQPIPNRKSLEDKVADFEKQIGEETIELPEFWGGYRLVANAIEFWQGRQNRLHDRLTWCRASPDETWQLQRLSP